MPLQSMFRSWEMNCFLQGVSAPSISAPSIVGLEANSSRCRPWWSIKSGIVSDLWLESEQINFVFHRWPWHFCLYGRMAFMDSVGRNNKRSLSQDKFILPIIIFRCRCTLWTQGICKLLIYRVVLAVFGKGSQTLCSEGTGITSVLIYPWL